MQSRSKWARRVAIIGVISITLMIVATVLCVIVAIRIYSLSKKEEFLNMWEAELSTKEEELHQREINVANAAMSIASWKADLDDQMEDREEELYKKEVDLKVKSALNAVKVETQVSSSVMTLSMTRTARTVVEGDYYPTAEELEKMELTADEFDYVCRLVYAEANNQSYEGKLAVAEVIRNRRTSKKFPDTISEIIADKNQFSPYSNGEIIACKKVVTNDNVTTEIRQAVAEAFKGSNITEELLKEEASRVGITDSKYWEGGALYFLTVNRMEELSKVKNVRVKVTIGDHNFRRVYSE